MAQSNIHEELIMAVEGHRQSEYRLACLLFELMRTKAYREKACTTLVQYAEMLLGLERRKAYDLARIGRRMERLPVLAATFASGGLDYTKAREIVRIAKPETEQAWVDAALRATSRELERMVRKRGAENGPAGIEDDPEGSSDAPLPPARDDVPPPGPAFVKLTFELASADAELLLRALAVMRQDVGLPERALWEDDDSAAPEIGEGMLLAALARRYLHRATEGDAPAVTSNGTRPMPPARFRTIVTRCPECERAHVSNHEVPGPIDSEARCDAEVIDLTRPAEPGEALGRSIPTHTRRRVFAANDHRCAVPGCRSYLFVDLHHVRYWADEHHHEEKWLLPLCEGHHRLVHADRLVITRRSDGLFVFLHADGTPFGTPLTVRPAPSCVEAAREEAAAIELLDEGAASSFELARRLERSPLAMLEVLRRLRRLGRVVELPRGEWARVDRIARPAPAWVAHAA